MLAFNKRREGLRFQLNSCLHSTKEYANCLLGNIGTYMYRVLLYSFRDIHSNYWRILGLHIFPLLCGSILVHVFIREKKCLPSEIILMVQPIE